MKIMSKVYLVKMNTTVAGGNTDLGEVFSYCANELTALSNMAQDYDALVQSLKADDISIESRGFEYEAQYAFVRTLDGVLYELTVNAEPLENVYPNEMTEHSDTPDIPDNFDYVLGV